MASPLPPLSVGGPTWDSFVFLFLSDSCGVFGSGPGFRALVNSFCWTVTKETESLFQINRWRFIGGWSATD